MPVSSIVVSKIKAILFDMNGTLRQRIPDQEWQRKYTLQLLTMLGKPDAPAAFLKQLAQRYKTYTRWADEQGLSLPEAEIWTRWIAPELPRELIEPQAAGLMLAFRKLKGPHVLKANAESVVSGLHLRSYRLGVISNTTSTADLPHFINEWGLQKYFETVILSSLCGVRKPNPEIFWRATRSMHLEPAQCAYVGNKISTDVVGARKAGFSISIIVETQAVSHPNEKSISDKPDLLIRQLVELLDVFPARAKG